MLIATDRNNLHRIVVLNPKGGSGKTTLATNIAAYYAMRGPAPTFMSILFKGHRKILLKWI